MRQARTFRTFVTLGFPEFVASGRLGGAGEVIRAAMPDFERREAEQAGSAAAKVGKAGL